MLLQEQVLSAPRARHLQHGPTVRLADAVPRRLREQLPVHQAGVRQHPGLELHLHNVPQRRVVHRHDLVPRLDVHQPAAHRGRLHPARERAESPERQLFARGRLLAESEQPAGDRVRGRGVLRAGGELRRAAVSLVRRARHGRQRQDQQRPQRRVPRVVGDATLIAS